MQQLRIDSILAGHAVSGHGRPAITFNGKVTDFAGLEAQVASMAGWLAARLAGRLLRLLGVAELRHVGPRGIAKRNKKEAGSFLVL